MDDKKPILEMRSIAKRYGSVTALAGVDFTLRRGEVMALLGENGAGKSTLVKILAGLERPDSGTIEIDGQAVRFRSPHQSLHAGVAYVTQELSIISALSVAENICLGGNTSPIWTAGQLAQRVRPYLDLVGLGDIDPVHARRASFRRSAATRRDRAPALEECAHPHPGRTDCGSVRRRDRKGDDGRAVARARRSIDHLRHPPARRGVRARRSGDHLPQRRQLRSGRSQVAEHRRADRAPSRTPARPDVPGARRLAGRPRAPTGQRDRAGAVPAGLARAPQGGDTRAWPASSAAAPTPWFGPWPGLPCCRAAPC